MRRLALAALIAATLAPAAHAAELTASPTDFSPALRKLLVHAQLPESGRVGVELPRPAASGSAGSSSRPGAASSPCAGTAGSMALASRTAATSSGWPAGRRGTRAAPLRLDATAPTVTKFKTHNRGDPWPGDTDLLTTISPTGDGLRDFARVRFALSESAKVHFEVTRTISTPTSVYELDANLKAGRNLFTWYPKRTSVRAPTCSGSKSKTRPATGAGTAPRPRAPAAARARRSSASSASMRASPRSPTHPGRPPGSWSRRTRSS